ncbi:MAG: M24 family metallopeptidase [Metallibacterium sp.]
MTHHTSLHPLRSHMNARGVAACIVPTADPHLSEYLPTRWKTRAWLSGFSGSAGTLVVGGDFAGLWTDSRYFEQAERELAGSGIALMKQHVAHAPEHLAWLATRLNAGAKVSIAADMLSLAGERQVRATFDPAGIELLLEDLPGAIWSARPALPTAPIRAYDPAFACATRGTRLASTRAALHDAGATHHLISSLDDIAWITLLRGSDVEYNPVFLAHLLLDAERATLFVTPGKIDAALAIALHADGITLADYADIDTTCAALPHDSRLLVDPARVAVATLAALPASVQRIEASNPSTAAKARKSTGELEHWREVMARDGAALVRAFRQIDTRVRGGEQISELDVDDIVCAERARETDFIAPSFATIAGYAANGALPHYRATPQHHARLQARGLLLVDSGAQYLGGTTDITRVWALGDTTTEEREDFTRVLAGMIALSRARFPAGASGPQLDALARAPLWAANADYGHGTGHGVGYFLNVHEGPQGIRPPVPGSALVALEPGMVTSIEPGLYRPGHHGVRHENLAATRTCAQSEFGTFLEFETLTLCPFDTRPLLPALLDAAARAWLDAYHVRVRTLLAPRLSGGDRDWLEARCAPLAAA